MDLPDFAGRLDDELDVGMWASADYAVNGLQVGPETAEVEHAAFAVDGVVATFEDAADAGADVLVVHHGISWGGIDRITGKEFDRVRTLLDNDLALYAVHGPLDAHPEYGNAAQLCEFLDLSVEEPFGRDGPGHVGQRGRTDDPYTPTELREKLAELENGGEPVQHLDFGPDEISDVAVLTGSGVDWLDEAREKGVDALVTGEGKQPAYHEAREAGIHVFLAGHYATETFGVRALQDLVEEWGLETTYLSHPTGL
ncbi:Nif3-like dinuclear metal center hexameric protein [Halorarius litoreus]|uniref:Nif3-like dinuclear metal center hexameric protein n=1 Tax=Halorarius litoreus TaxID=2962676 RepID=UPI0020CF720D|nr:Nif3-like dinuclear metal center hexameric protein [Halorarius litoreus]